MTAPPRQKRADAKARTTTARSEKKRRKKREPVTRTEWWICPVCSVAYIDPWDDDGCLQHDDFQNGGVPLVHVRRVRPKKARRK